MEKWEKLKGLNEQQIKDMQLVQLRAFFAELADRHPYYTRIFKEKAVKPDSLTGLEGLPFTVSNELARGEKGMSRMERFALAPAPAAEAAPQPQKKSLFGKLFKGGGAAVLEAPDPKDYRLYQALYAGDFSTWSLPLVYTSYDIERVKEAGRRLFDLWGLTRDDTMVNAFSYAPSLGFWQVFYGGLELGSTLLQSGGGRILGTEKILTALENMKAEVLFASPLYAKHLLQAAIKFEADIRNLTTVILGMEPASREIMERIKDLMKMAGTAGSRVLRSYSLTEAKTSWGECEGADGLHIQPDLHLVEVIDPVTGKVKGEGEAGEILLTHLDTRGTCLVRYRTGLRTTGGLSCRPCSTCGSSLPRLTGELEELKNTIILYLPGGGQVTVNLEEITRRLDSETPLLLWQGTAATGEVGKPRLTITAAWFNRDDSPAQALAGELTERYGVEVVFNTDSYTSILGKLGLETAFSSRRWVIG